MFDKLFRPCPVCRTRLTELMKRKENNVDWVVYVCPNCGSEIWIDHYKNLRYRYK
jgi:uncharacterized protein with PIN domain